MKTLVQRLILDFLILGAIFVGWWFVALPLAIIGAWLFPYFAETIIAGIIYDSLFGYTDTLGLAGYVGTISSVLIVIMILFLKNIMRK